MKRRIALLVLALPLLVFVIAVVKAEIHLSKGEIFRFSITGYDPRDLLRGHYLQFRVAYDWDEEAGTCQSDSSDDCCLCLMGSSSSPPRVVRATCEEARSQCDGALLESESENLTRFYIPEESARKAEDLLFEGQREGSATIVVSIKTDGRAQLVDLEIGGESLTNLLTDESLRSGGGLSEER